jgi:hypothetical protein
VVPFDVNEKLAVGRAAELRKQLVITINFSLPVQLEVLRPPDFHGLFRFNIPKKKLAISNLLNSVLWWGEPASQHRQIYACECAGHSRQNEAFHRFAERPGSGRPGQWCSFDNRPAIPALPAAGRFGAVRFISGNWVGVVIGVDTVCGGPTIQIQKQID